MAEAKAMSIKVENVATSVAYATAAPTWDERLFDRLAQLQAGGVKKMTIHQVVGLIGFVRDGEGGAPPVRSAAMNEWQPIETAPRNGTQFLAAMSNGWVLILSERPGSSERFEWYVGNGGSIPVARTHREGSLTGRILATHWMPLPAGPIARHERGTSQRDTVETIPTGVYFNFAEDNFYTDVTGAGCGRAFYDKWKARWREFPASRESAQ